MGRRGEEAAGASRSWRGVLRAVLPLALALLALAAWDSAFAPPPLRVTQAGSRADSGARLVVFMVDSLDARDVQGGRMPLLQRRIARGALHGPVRACADAVTVPCFAAMLTGFDAGGPVSTLRNFVAQRSLVQHSVLGALRSRGLRVGYLGELEVARLLTGLDHVEQAPAHDGLTLERATRVLDEQRLSLLLVHLRSVDQAAHKYTERSPVYGRTLQELDHTLAQSMARLRSEDHLAVLGDHGHSVSGRHIAELGGVSYAVYLGPRFARPLRRSMAMTDHAALWASVFDLQVGPMSWVQGYLGGTGHASSSVTLRGAPLRGDAAWALWGMACCALALGLLGLGALRAASARRAAWLAMGSLLAGGLGAWGAPAWSWLSSPLGKLAWLLASALAGTLWFGRAPRGSFAWALAGVAGTMLLALPVLTPFGGLQVAIAGALLACAALVVRCARAKELPDALAWAAATLILAALWPTAREQGALHPAVSNSPGWDLLALLAALLAILHRLPTALERGGLLLGCGYAGLQGALPAQAFLPACVLALPCALYALCAAQGRPLALLLVPPALLFFVQGQLSLLSPIALVGVLWAFLPVLLARAHGPSAGAALLLLVALSFWSVQGARMSGVDFDFYFRWLPQGADATSQLLPQALLTCAKSLLPALLGMLLAQRAGPLPVAPFQAAEQLACARLSLCISFALGLSLGPSASDVIMRSDVAQELLFWLLALSVTGLVSLGARVQARRAASMRRPRHMMGVPLSASSPDSSEMAANTSANSG